MSPPANETLNELVQRTTHRVLARIAQVQPLTVPFRHCSINNILPNDVYAGLDAYRYEILSSKMSILQSLPHGNVNAVLTMMRSLDVESLLASRSCRERDIVIAMIAD